ncbi:dicarboxylate--CoA ligase PimA [Sphingomonas lenta]|uniref:Dicarboxylate--CoA ligase PimA n=2 Tax=Sphingomonas lenta TaxID=1141887 RepID=A0A2A2SI12_9SPHN|nr:long-chain fatty acid--CoA ligase [Sphingomonas lenta]PAX08863.1 dicarboxylate--CoA ligase PimA [Sphingomonas lenta]
MLDLTVTRHGALPAIDFMGRITTWRELSELADSAAASLQLLGVTPGTRVALCLPNTPHYPVLYLATLRVGGVVVNANPLYSERELEHLIADSGAEVVATCDIPDVHARVTAVAARLSLRHVITCPVADALPWPKRFAYKLLKRGDIAPLDEDAFTFDRLVSGPRRPKPVSVRSDALAVLQYTGGTTGTPKAAMLSHANLVANADAMVAHMGEARGAPCVVMGVLPLFHVFALTTVLNFALRTGAKMVLLPRFELGQLIATLDRTRPDYLPVVPTILHAVARAAEKRPIDLSYVGACISGGAPLAPETRRAFQNATGARVVEGYGLSEASPIVACQPLGGDAPDGSVGRPFPGTDVEIRDPDAPDRLLMVGEVGEICVRGPQVICGYWNRPDETDAIFVDGALRTGDLGRIDERGNLFIVDRLKNMILCGGYNVYPRVIEEALTEHPAVAEVVVIGVPDEYRGEAPKAFVVLKEATAATPAELRAFLADRLSRIELPREIELRESLPKTLIGKPSRKELVEEERAKRLRPVAGESR